MKFRALTAAVGAMAMASSLSISAPAQAQVDPYIGQMMLTGANFCPRGWSTAEGQLLAINTYQALFSLLGTTYGGDGRTSFALPDLRGRAPIGIGNGPGLASQSWGQRGGSESFTLNVTQMPSHNHTGTVLALPSAANSTRPVRNYFAIGTNGTQVYASSAASPTNFMGANSLRIANTGGGQSVNKRSPYLAMYWCVAMVGIYPSRS